MNSQKLIDQAFDYYPRLARVRDYVFENLGETISLKEAAKAAALETRYFARFFKSKTGITFKDWLNIVRIDRAKEMLKREDVSISSVASGIGYDSERTFRRAFKKRAGITPSEYRRLMRPKV